jgi:hypothetical protein
MARRSRPSSQKRNKEKARQQKQQDKVARRLEAKQRKANEPSGIGFSLDLDGLQPGPQPVPAPGDDASDRA